MIKANNQKIYHYTSIESLALILKSQKIRFTRMDRVDDVREAQEHCGINFGRYFFVSCRTEEETESIPQWNMYSKDMQGVRIELPTYPFHRHRIKANSRLTGVTWEGEAMSPLTLEEMLGPTYFIQPLCSDDFFCGQVNYIDNVKEYYSSAIRRKENSNGGVGITIKGFPQLPRQKSKDWSFQSEFRFHLFAMPIPAGVTNQTPFPPGIGLGEVMSDALIKNIAPEINFIDIPLHPNALSQMVIRTGPLCTPAGEICVEALVSHLAPEAKIEPSALSGTLRTKP